MMTTVSDLSPLDRAPPGLRARLREMIGGGHDSFVLIGSDPGRVDGCCPSDEVGEALRLAELGILQVHRPPAREGACPSTVFTCAGEMDPSTDPPTCTPDPALRERILARLALVERRERRGRICAWCLLAFIAAVLVVGGAKLARRDGPSLPDHRVLGIPADADLVMAAFFHRRKRCPFCRSLERGLRDALAREELADAGVRLRMLVTDDPAVRRFQMAQGGFDSGIVLLEVEDGRVRRQHLIAAAYERVGDPPALEETIAREIEGFLAAGGK